MATIDMSDDDDELLHMVRGRLLGVESRRESSPKPVKQSVADAPVVEPAAVAAEAERVDMASVAPVSQVREDAPRPSFASARPRQSGEPAPAAVMAPPAAPVPSAAPAPPPVAVPAPSPARADATPGDVVDDTPAPTVPDVPAPAAVEDPPAVDAPAPATPVAAPTAEALSDLLGGVDVDKLRRVLASNPDILNPERVEELAAAADDVSDEPARPAPSLARADLATQGWRSWLVKLGIPVRKSASERFEEALESAREVIRRDLDGPLVIGVTSYRGSCGKTSTTVLLSRLLTEIRGDDVLALDTDLHGTLLPRSVGDDHPSRSQGATMSEAAERLRDGVDLRSIARNGDGGYAFIPGSQTFRANAVDADGYQMIIEAARQAYPIVLVDMSLLSDTDLYAVVLRSLDAVVMMSPAAKDGVGYLYRTQSELQHRGVDALNGHRITLLNNVASVRSDVDTVELARGLKHRDKRDVAEIPHDRHLVRPDVIELAQLSPTTKAAFTFSLAALISTL